MPRNYKTGPARSRRRADPSNQVQPGQSVCPLIDGGIVPGAGTLTIGVEVTNPATGESWSGVPWYKTNLPSTSFFIDVNGTRHPLVVDTVSAFGIISFVQLTGLPAGTGYLVITPLDPAIRNEAAAWIGGMTTNENIA